ncbi:MAG: RCC1 domain-containing protein [Saccharofermentanales bacterium]
MYYRMNKIYSRFWAALLVFAFVSIGISCIPALSAVDASAKTTSAAQASISEDILSGAGAGSTDESAEEEPEPAEYDAVYRKGMISAGLYHTVLLNESGEVYAWGDNSFGQLGIGSTDNKEIPMKVEGLTDVVMVSAGAYHTLALTSSGDIYAWGRNTYGQIGNGATSICISPVRVEDIPPVLEISAGAFHSIALAINGSVYTWGDNSSGQSGPVESETIYDSAQNILGSRVLKPQLLAGPGILSVSAGGSHSLYLDADGIVYAWGNNESGQLGDGTQISRDTPAPVAGLTSVISISAGYMYNMAVGEFTSGKGASAFRYQNLFAWGSDSSGQLGLGLGSDQLRIVMTPVRVDANNDANESNDRISLIDAGYYSSMMTVPVFKDGRRRDSVYVWGNNSYGQLGIGEMPTQYKPLKLVGISNGWEGDSFLPFQSISAGGYHTALLSVKGFTGVVGRADKGQLGNVSSINASSFSGVSIRDAIAPEWSEDTKLEVRLTSVYLQLKWTSAMDNIAVAGYRLTYTDKDGESVTIKLGIVNEYTILDFDRNSNQTMTLSAIDKTGNKSEFPLEHVFGDAGTSVMESSGAESSDETGEDIYSEPDAAPGAEGTADIDYLRWNPVLYSKLQPPEVPWDVDYIYGPGVVPPPDDNSVEIAIGVTVSVIVISLLFSLTNFRRNHKGHGLIEEIFRPHNKPHDIEIHEDGRTVDIGDGIEILPDDKDDK